MNPKGPDMSSRSLKFLLLAVVIEMFAMVFALSSSGLQVAVFITGVVGVVIAFLAVGMRDQA
jgi:hypothetical protein